VPNKIEQWKSQFDRVVRPPIDRALDKKIYSADRDILNHLPNQMTRAKMFEEAYAPRAPKHLKALLALITDVCDFLKALRPAPEFRRSAEDLETERQALHVRWITLKQDWQ